MIFLNKVFVTNKNRFKIKTFIKKKILFIFINFDITKASEKNLIFFKKL